MQVFGKRDGDTPRARNDVLKNGVVPIRAIVNAPARFSPRRLQRVEYVHTDSMTNSISDSHIFDQSSLDEDDLSYENRAISPIFDDASVGSSVQHIAREIDMMEGSYFSTREAPLLPHVQRTHGVMSRSVLTTKGMERIKDVSSSDDDEDEEDDTLKKYPLSTPYRSQQLSEDWVKAWGEAWGLNVNKAEEQKRRNRLNALQARRESFMTGTLFVQKSLKSSSSAPSPQVTRRDGPSVSAVLDRSLSKAAAKTASSPPPPGPKSPAKSPWEDRTLEWAASERLVATPANVVTMTDKSLASAQKTVKKSKWVFGDDELTEDEEDKKLGEENQDGEEPWQRSAKKQHQSLERFRKAPHFETTLDNLQNTTTSKQRRPSNPTPFRRHGLASREQLVRSDEDEVHSEHHSILKYTPDLAKLRKHREKLRSGGQESDDDDFHPLFRRADGRLVRQGHPVVASADHSVSVAPLTVVDLGHHDRVGAWV